MLCFVYVESKHWREKAHTNKSQLTQYTLFIVHNVCLTEYRILEVIHSVLRTYNYLIRLHGIESFEYLVLDQNAKINDCQSKPKLLLQTIENISLISSLAIKSSLRMLLESN